MTYAIISDIHGNYPAFEAVLADAKAHGADEYILLGDYVSRYPWANETAEAMRKLKPAHIVRGNGEDYFTELLQQPQDKFADLMTAEQWQPVTWAYKTLSPGNLEYLLALPETAVIQHQDTNIYLSHTIDLIFTPPAIEFFHTLSFHDMMTASPFTHEEYLARGREMLLSNPVTLAQIRALPKGIYAFGHNHLQFFMEYEGRLFINPGSCGNPADWDAAAVYSLLRRENDAWTVTERRVKYDLDKVTQGLITSGYQDYAPAWSHAAMVQILTGKEYMGLFVTHFVAEAKRLGHTQGPIRGPIWDAAVKSWYASQT